MDQGVVPQDSQKDESIPVDNTVDKPHQSFDSLDYGAGTDMEPNTKKADSIKTSFENVNDTVTTQLNANTGARANKETRQQVDMNKRNICRDETKDRCITIAVYHKGVKDETATVNHFCTLEDYMKWRYILQSPYHLEHINALIQKEHSALKDNAVLKADGNLEVQFSTQDNDYLKQICSEVVKISLEQTGFKITEIDVMPEDILVCQRKIEESNLVETKKIWCEMFNNRLLVVYLTRHKREVDDFLKTIMDDPQNKKAIEIALPSYWGKLCQIIDLKQELKVASKGSELTVKFELNSKGSVCKFVGEVAAVTLAEKRLQSLLESVKEECCEFEVVNKTALGELQVEDFLNDYLHQQNLKCVARQDNCKIIVFGFDEDAVKTGRLEVEKIIIEKHVVLTREQSNSLQDLIAELVKSHDQKVVVYSESGINPDKYVFGIKESVDTIIENLENTKEAHITPSTEKYESENVSYKIEDKDMYEYFLKSSFVATEAKTHHLQITPSTEHSMNVVMVSSKKGGTKEGKQIIQMMKNGFKFEIDSFNDSKTCRFFSEPQGKLFVEKCSSDNDVMIYLTVAYSCSSERIKVNDKYLMYPDATHTRKITWLTEENKTLHLTSVFTPSDVKTKILKATVQQHEGNDIGDEPKDGDFLEKIEVSVWSGDRADTTADNLKSLFSKVEKQKEPVTVILTVNPPPDWPLSDFIKTVVSVSVKVLLDAKTLHTQSIYLIPDKNERFDIIAKDVQSTLEEKTIKKSQLKILVVKGELSNAKVDVVVNTTSKNLDLRNGRVSSSLLKAAGSKLQQECDKHYPHGIKCMEIAMTNGYKLHCRKVFHVALENFEMQKADESVEIIRTLVYLCLNETSRLGLNTIAFPAMGTGLLGYPIELVGAAMFDGVERFRTNSCDTTLEEVQFVIYNTDEPAMKEFRKHEQMLGGHRGTVKPNVELKICGLSDNVKKAQRVFCDKSNELRSKSDEAITFMKEVTVTNFKILSLLYRTELTNLARDGVDVKQENGYLIVSGKQRLLQTAEELLNKKLSDVAKMEPFVVPIQDFDESLVEREIEFVNTTDRALACIFDRNSKVVNIYSKSKKKAESCKTDFIANLRDKANSTQKENINADEQTACCKPVTVSSTVSDKKEVKNPTGNDTNRVAQTTVKPSVSDTSHHASKTMTRQVQIKETSFKSGNCIVYVYNSDILQVNAECLVNPANSKLNHFGGLAGAIAKAGGDSVNIESAEIIRKHGGDLPVSTVVSANGFGSFKMLLHAVGPCWNDYNTRYSPQIENCKMDLKRTVFNCFKVAESFNMKSIAVPTISSGLFGVPKDVCATQYADAVLEFTLKCRVLKEIYFVDIDGEMVQIMQQTFAKMLDKQQININAHATSTDIAKCTATPKREKRADTFIQSEQNTENMNQQVCVGTSHDLKTINITECIERFEFSFSSNFQVLIYEGDIMKLEGVDALVCSENRKGEGTGEISELIHGVAGPSYMTEKVKCFSTKRNFGDVMITSGGKSKFQFILHAVVPQKNPDALKMMYGNIFETAIKQESITSMAITLLGTATKNIWPEDSASILWSEWEGFCTRYQNYNKNLVLHVVIKEKDLADVVKMMFKERIDSLKGRGNISKDHPKYISENMYDVNTPVDIKHETSKKDNGKRESLAVDKELANCVICMDRVTNEKKLKCGHIFCKDCIEGYFHVKMACPTCGKVCGIITGDQPDGTMEVMKIRGRLAGYSGRHIIAVTYKFSDGVQGSHHPNPSSRFRGISRTAYLPDNKEGQIICGMLTVAFKRRLVFTIGISRTTGQQGVITWNDIHHKTDARPNTQFGYPDATYLQRVREELEIKGVTKDDVGQKLTKALRKDDYRNTFSCSSKE